jgi:hypothetical protein
MIDAEITSVDRKRSCVLRSSCSRAMARLISPSRSTSRHPVCSARAS